MVSSQAWGEPVARGCLGEFLPGTSREVLGSGKGRFLQILEFRAAVFLLYGKFAVTSLQSFLVNFNRADFWSEDVSMEDKKTRRQAVCRLL